MSDLENENDPKPLAPQHHDPEEVAHAFLDRLRTPGRLMVAASGGSDSTALLLALHHALAERPRPGVEVVVATVVHGLRVEAAAEAAGVAAFCTRLGIEHRTLRWTGDKPATGIQDAARQARHRLLRQAANNSGAVAVLTGHTRDDQFETVAMRRARGEIGNDGLAGMAVATLYGRDCWIIRPFLALGRGDLREYLRARGVSWTDDPSNDDPRFERARLRRNRAAVSMDPEEIARAGKARRRRTDAVAALLRSAARGWRGVAFELAPRDEAVPAEIYRDAVAEIATLAGGAAHRPGRRQLDDLAGFLTDPQARRHTLARAVIDKRHRVVFIHREVRDLLAGVVRPAGSVVWDQRFAVANHDPARRLRIGPAGLAAVEERADEKGDIPRRIIKTAMLGQPCFSFSVSGALLPFAQLSPADRALIEVERIIPRHDTFLPAFDRMLADAVAALVERPPYAAPPIYLD